MRISFVCVAIAWVACASSLPGDSAPGVPRQPLRHLTAPLYEADNPRPVAVIQVGRIHPDYERKGFFRIGLLPLLVADEVEIDLRTARNPLEALRRAAHRLQMLRRPGLIELRHVTVRFPPSTQSRLKAGRVRFGQDGQWQLLDGAVWEAGGTRLEATRAALHLTGALAGTITFETSPRASVAALPDLSSAVPPVVNSTESP